MVVVFRRCLSSCFPIIVLIVVVAVELFERSPKDVFIYRKVPPEGTAIIFRQSNGNVLLLLLVILGGVQEVEVVQETQGV